MLSGSANVSRPRATDRRTEQPDARVGAHEGDLDQSQHGVERLDRRGVNRSAAAQRAAVSQQRPTHAVDDEDDDT